MHDTTLAVHFSFEKLIGLSFVVRSDLICRYVVDTTVRVMVDSKTWSLHIDETSEQIVQVISFLDIGHKLLSKNFYHRRGLLDTVFSLTSIASIGVLWASLYGQVLQWEVWMIPIIIIVDLVLRNMRQICQRLIRVDRGHVFLTFVSHWMLCCWHLT